MSFVNKLAKIAFSTLIYMIVFDIVGVAASFLLDVTPLRGKSSLAFYAIWFVLGVFCGFLSYNYAGGKASPESKEDWTNGPDARKTSLVVILGMLAPLVLVSAVSYVFMWRNGVEESYFVPDDMVLTITFFVGILGATAVAHKLLLPDPKKL